MMCPTCEKPLDIGEYPFCPHGFPAGNTRAMVDEWPMGKTFENGFSEPRTFYCRSEYHKALAEQGLRVRPDMEHKGVAITAETLKNAQILVSRCS